MAKLSEIRHDYLRYANVWEDAAILLDGLQAQPGLRHLSIASAGDNAFMLLTTNPELVVGVDINQPQIFLCALKKAAIRALTREEYLAFVGFEPANNRKAVFEKIAGDLSEEARQYWENNLELLESGVVITGKFERYFRLFSKWVLPLIHTQKTVEQLLAPKSAAQQEQFYHEKWNTWRWRLLFKIFFSKFVMGRAGRDPAFLNEVQVPVGEYIFQKAERHLCSTLAQNNHILRFNLTGNFGKTLPDYVQPAHYERVKANIEKLELHYGLVESAFQQWGKFDCFNLSNIFEYMDEATFKAVATQLMSGANPGARFGYWNLMVPRNMADVFPQELRYDPAQSEKAAQSDRGFFYNKFIVNTLNHATTSH